MVTAGLDHPSRIVTSVKQFQIGLAAASLGINRDSADATRIADGSYPDLLLGR